MAVIGFELRERKPLVDGAPFGDVGPYEIVSGLLQCAVDPDHPRNAGIADLKLAPRDDAGRVRFTTDLTLIQPVDAQQGNRRILFDVVNRGRKLALRMFNGGMQAETATSLDLGNGFLMRQGYTLVWCGWQHDVPEGPGQLHLHPPEALQDGRRVRGRILVELQVNQPAQSTLLSDRNHTPYPAAILDEPGATLTVRDHIFGERRLVSRDRWRFARDQGGVAILDPSYLHVDDGLEPGRIYEVVYTTEGVPVVGAGLLAIRDTVAYLRYSSGGDGSLVRAPVARTYAFGASQSGRVVRHFLYLGLNEDESERLVFDGVISHIAAHGRGQFNHRFGQPSSISYWDGSGSFPFSDDAQTDPVTGARDGLMARLQQRGKAPKVFHVNSSGEYWRGGAALIHTDATGEQDIEFAENARGYLLSGTQHGPGTLPLIDTNPLDGSRARYAFNSVDYTPLLRAALVNLDAWVTRAVEPPASRVPRLADATAVPRERVAEAIRQIPGLVLPDEWGTVLRLDFGPGWAEGRMDILPPRVAGESYPCFVSAVDDDGNDLAGVRLPDLSVPLATYTGWNLRHPDIGAPHLTLPLQGATLPFPRTAAERRARSDPRPAIEERYASRQTYLDQVRAAAEALIHERLLLPEDLDGTVAKAAARWDELAGIAAGK